MSRISSILGYSLFALILVYFAISNLVENKVEETVQKFATRTDLTGAIGFRNFSFSFLTGKAEVEKLTLEQLDDFHNISADRAAVQFSWKDRFRFLLEQGEALSKLQQVAIELHGLKMYDQKLAAWTAGYTRVAFAGDINDALITFLQQKETNKSFRSSISVERANIVPPPAFMDGLPVSGFYFPMQNLRLESVYDPGIHTLRTDAFFAKKDTSESRLSLTIVYDDKKKAELKPKRAVLALQTRLNGENRRFKLNDAGNELTFQRIRFTGNLDLDYAYSDKTGQFTWIPEVAVTRLALHKPVLYPSADFMRTYGLLMQTFGFENGFAQFDSLGGNILFNKGILSVNDMRLYADWLDAEIDLKSSLFQNKGFDAPIQDGAITIRKLGSSLLAGVRFVERQTQKKHIRSDGSIKLDIIGSLNAPKLKGLF